MEKTLAYYKICPFPVNYESEKFYNTGSWINPNDKVAGVKVYLRQNRNSRAHAVTACISL